MRIVKKAADYSSTIYTTATHSQQIAYSGFIIHYVLIGIAIKFKTFETCITGGLSVSSLTIYRMGL